MEKFFRIILITGFVILFFSNFHYANGNENIEMEINVSENYSLYFIKWKIIVDFNYYYPSGSEFKINLPDHYETINVRDNLGEVYFRVSNSSLIIYNRRNIYHGDDYYFYITIKQNYNPLYYDGRFYFRNYYSSIPMKINFPEWTTKFKVLSGKNYKTNGSSILTNYSINIVFWGKELEEEKVNLTFENLNAYIPKKYIDIIYPILDEIDKYYWNRFEEIFSIDTRKINFNLVAEEQEDWICYYHNSSIYCSIEILFYKDEYIKKAILHEIAHYFISSTIGKGLTPWLEEGIAEKISRELSNFIKDEKEKEIIENCFSALSYEFWKSWECEKFSNCNTTYYSDNFCIDKYGINNLRYIFSLEIVNKTLDIYDIKEISKFFRNKNISILYSSENKNDVAIFLIYLFGNNYKEIEKHKIKFDDLNKINETFNLYKKSKEEISNYSKSFYYNFFEDASYIVERSLNLIFNGYFDNAEIEINNAIEMARNTKIVVEKIKERITYMEEILNSCYYEFPYSLIFEANKSYMQGDLNKSIEYLNKALLEKDIIDKKIEKIREKIIEIKSSWVYTIFSEKIKAIEKDFDNCKLEEAENKIKELESVVKMITLSILLILLFSFMLSFYVIFKRCNLKSISRCFKNSKHLKLT